MVKRKVVWSLNAELELFETLDYYLIRNKSVNYSKKLHLKIKAVVSELPKYPLLGKPVGSDQIRKVILENYLIIYEVSIKYIEILQFWDTRRNPEILATRLEQYKPSEE